MIRKRLAAAPVALLFGSEKFGLSNEDMSYCHWLLRIGTEGSMNLGQAVAVSLYELARKNKPQSSTPAPPKAEACVNEQISQVLLEALNQSGYIQPGSEAACENKVRRMVLRFGLDPEDAKVLLGMVRQIVWRLRQGKS